MTLDVWDLLALGDVCGGDARGTYHPLAACRETQDPNSAGLWRYELKPNYAKPYTLNKRYRNLSLHGRTRIRAVALG